MKKQKKKITTQPTKKAPKQINDAPREIRCPSNPLQLTPPENPHLVMIMDRANEMFPSRDQDLERIGYTMVEWFKKNPKAIRFKTFYLAYGIRPQNMLKWKERSDYLFDAYETVKMIIAERRQEFISKKSYGYNENWLAFDMHRYDSEFGEDEVRRAKIKEDAQSSSITPVVVINQTKDLDEKKACPQ